MTLRAALAAALALAPTAALAHPHVLVDARVEIVFDDAGRVTGVRHVWRFDDAFSAYASQGLDADGDGVFSTAELQPLAEINVQSLKDFRYFTFVRAGGSEVVLQDPTEYWLQSDGGPLTLFFTLPTSAPLEIRSLPFDIDVFDPSFFVAFSFVEQDDAVQLVGGYDPSCTLEIVRPTGLDDGTAGLLAQIPADGTVPSDLLAVTMDLSNGATILCP